MNSFPDILHHLELEVLPKMKEAPKSKLKIFTVDKILEGKIQTVKSSDILTSKLKPPMKFDVQKIAEKKHADTKPKVSERREIPQKSKQIEMNRTSERRSVYAFGSSTPRMSDSFIAMSTSSSRRSIGSNPIAIPKSQVSVDRNPARSSMCGSSISSSRSSVSEKICTPTTRRSFIPRIPRVAIQTEKIPSSLNSRSSNLMSRSITKDTSTMITPSPRKSSCLIDKALSESKIKGNRITTEEQAKFLLAERRRTIREENQRKTDLENQRIEEQRIVLKKQNEITKQRILEERIEREQRKELDILTKKLESDKLAEKIKAERLVEERNRIEEAEHKMKIELAAMEREKQEANERLKKEEIERETRRKRVEIIMSRTRAKKSAIKTNDENKNIEANR